MMRIAENERLDRDEPIETRDGNNGSRERERERIGKFNPCDTEDFAPRISRWKNPSVFRKTFPSVSFKLHVTSIVREDIAVNARVRKMTGAHPADLSECTKRSTGLRK
jgi:hypothetical protein